jgi:hypothetical protein
MLICGQLHIRSSKKHYSIETPGAEELNLAIDAKDGDEKGAKGDEA